MFDAKKDIGLLHPLMRRCVIAWLEDCKAEDLHVYITETRRTKQRQLWLYCKGRLVPPSVEKAYLGYDDPNISSKPGEKKVTWTLESKHLKGFAIDFGFMNNWKFGYEGNWDRAFDLAEKHGMISLWRTSGLEKPHLEYKVI